MRKMQIDFAAPGWRRSLHRLHPAALGGCVLGLALCAGAALYGYQLVQRDRARAEQVRQQEREFQRLQAAQQRAGSASGSAAAAAAAQAKVQIPEALGKAVNAAVLQLNLPWGDLQAAVSAATPPAIALLALEPDPNKQLLKISAEAKNTDDMIGYIEQLKEQAFFTGAALTRHEVSELDPNRPIRFQVEVQWEAR